MNTSTLVTLATQAFALVGMLWLTFRATNWIWQRAIMPVVAWFGNHKRLTRMKTEITGLVKAESDAQKEVIRLSAALEKQGATLQNKCNQVENQKNELNGFRSQRSSEKKAAKAARRTDEAVAAVNQNELQTVGETVGW